MEIALAVAALLGIPLLTAAIAMATEGPPKPRQAAKPLNQDTPGTAVWITVIVWALLSVVGIAAVLWVDFYSTIASDKGEEISHAFTFLTALAMPVAAMVIAVLVYSVLRRSSTGDQPPEDGPNYQGRGPFPKAWLAVTSGLTLLIIIYPGLWTLNDVIGQHDDPDLVISVDALQWTWLISYPEQEIENQFELVIPVDQEVTFEITSRDVAHSFWVPAFLTKIDAIPGRTTRLSLVATEVGDFSENSAYRIQCAELCGISHASMAIPVRVVTEAEFDEWVESKTAPAALERAE